MEDRSGPDRTNSRRDTSQRIMCDLLKQGGTLSAVMQTYAADDAGGGCQTTPGGGRLTERPYAAAASAASAAAGSTSAARGFTL